MQKLTRFLLPREVLQKLLVLIYLGNFGNASVLLQTNCITVRIICMPSTGYNWRLKIIHGRRLTDRQTDRQTNRLKRPYACPPASQGKIFSIQHLQSRQLKRYNNSILGEKFYNNSTKSTVYAVSPNLVYSYIQPGKKGML